MSKWGGDENCLQCADKEPDPCVHLPREDYNALRDERDRLRATIRTLCSSGNRLLDDLIGRSDAAESFKYQIKQAQAALTPAGGGSNG